MVTQYALDELGNEYTLIYLWGKVSKNMSWGKKKKLVEVVLLHLCLILKSFHDWIEAG